MIFSISVVCLPDGVHYARRGVSELMRMLEATPDLLFQPAAPKRLKKLSRDQISRYNSHGYIRPFDVFTREEIAEIRSYVGRLMADMGDAGSYGINCYQARLAGIWDIVTEPRILDHVEDIVGPNIICWASAILSKKPRDPKRVPWHQDAAFWHLSPARTVTVWLAIDDVDEGNSAMMFIPRTHRMGKVPVAAADDQSVFHIETIDADSLGAPVFNCLKAGQISLHADMLVHGSQANKSDRRRCGLTMRYCPPEARIIDGRWAEGIEAVICRGEDPAGEWKHHPRPGNDDITMTSSPHVVGNN